MLEVDQVKECKQLRSKGMGIRAIARKLEVSRYCQELCSAPNSGGAPLVQNSIDESVACDQLEELTRAVETSPFLLSA